MGPEMPEGGSKTSTVPVVWATSGIFSVRSKWFTVGRDFWPWTKPGYITMTRRPSNSEWSGGIAAHPAPKNSECKNPLENFPPRLFAIKTASSSLIIFQRAKLSTRNISHLCWCDWRTFWRKKRRVKVTKGVLFLHDYALAHRALATQKKLSYLGLQCLDHPPYSPDLTPSATTCSLYWKTIERSPFFVRRGGHCCRGDLVGRTTSWFFFWVACKS